MISSRSLDDLHPRVGNLARMLVAKAEDVGIDLLIFSTYRDAESQAALYAQGRSKPGRIVTNAKGGDSYHNWRVAFDVVPLVNGKAMWDGPWEPIAAIGRSLGFEYGGDWVTFKDADHFQLTGGLSIDDFRSGKTL